MAFGARLIETYDALFNTEAAKAFTVFASALNVPWIRTDTNPKNLQMNELGFLFLGTTGEFGWSAPESQVFTSLQAECQDLRARADASIRAMADKALQTHQSGVAIGITKGPKEVFLSLWRTPVKQALQTVIDEIADARKEQDLEPRLLGMDQLGEQASQMEVVTGKMLLGLPITRVAKESVIRQIVSTNADLSADEQVEFEKQLAAMTDEEINLVDANADGKDDQLDAEIVAKKTTTGEPQEKKI